MKIGYIYHRFPIFSKTGSYYKEYLESLVELRKDLQIVLITSKFPRDADVKIRKEINVLWLKNFERGPFGWVVFEVLAFLRGLFSQEFRSVDIIHVTSLRGLPAGYLLARILGKKLVLTVEILNDPQGSFSDRLFYQIQRTFYNHLGVSRIICWSHYFYKIMVGDWGMDKQKMVIIPPGINTSLFKPNVDGLEIKQKYAPKSNLIVFAKPLFLGNLSSALLLLESFSLLRDKNSFRILYGDGEFRDVLEKRIVEFGLSKYVRFMPPKIPFEEIPKYLAAADLIVLSFAYPPTVARSFLEALAMGKPVIATSVGEIPYLVQNRKHILLVSPDAKEIAGAVELLAANADLQKSLGHAARKLVVENYSSPKTALRVVEVYDSLLEPVK